MKLSKRATLNNLPIHLDPSMWKPEELMEVFKTPHLLSKLRADSSKIKLNDGSEVSRFEAAIKALKKAGIRIQDLLPRAPENWLKSGTFALAWGNEVLGFYKTKEHAERAKNHIIANFSINGVAPVGLDLLGEATKFMIAETTVGEFFPGYNEIGFDDSSEGVDDADVERYEKAERGAYQHADQELERVKHPTMGAPLRKKWAEDALNIVQIPKKLEDKDYAEGDEPTQEDYDKAKEVEFHDPTVQRTLSNALPESNWEVDKRNLRPIIDIIKKRIKAIDDDLDLSKLSDDGVFATKRFPISKRASLMPGDRVKIKEWDDSTAWVSILLVKDDLVVIQYDDGVAQSMSSNALKNQIVEKSIPN